MIPNVTHRIEEKSPDAPQRSCLFIWHYLLIVVAVFIIYSNTFRVPFQFDDSIHIVDTSIIKDLDYYRDLSRIRDPLEYRSVKGRYIGYLTVALNFKAGGLDVFGYHVINMIIHITNALLVYLLVLLSFRSPFLQMSQLTTSSHIIALFSALLFACHPVETQAVTYIIQRFASLATLFYLLSLTLYVKWRLTSSETNRQMPIYILSIVSAVLAMKTKEIAFTLPVSVALYELLFFKGSLKRRAFYLIPMFLTMLIIPLDLWDSERHLIQSTGDSPEGLLVFPHMSSLDYLYTQFRVIVTYIRLLLLPLGQNIDYDYPIYTSFLNPQVFFSFLFIVGLTLLGFYLVHRSRTGEQATRLVAFGIFWFFITLSVESSFIVIGDVIFEHRLYLPSTWVLPSILIAVYIAIKKRENPRLERAVILSLIPILLILSFATYSRNSVWKTKVSLWEDAVSKSPKKARAHYNLGISYQQRGEFGKAEEHYKVVLRILPDFKSAHNNLATLYGQKGEFDKAIEHFEIVLRLKPTDSNAHTNLGTTYAKKGLIDKAIEHYQRALSIEPENAVAHYGLYVAYKKKGIIKKAMEHFNKAKSLNPELVKLSLGKSTTY